LERAPEQPRRVLQFALVDVRADPRRRDARHERHLARVDPERPKELEVTGAAVAEAESLTRDDDLRADPEERVPCELLRLERGDVGPELDHEDVLHASFAEQLEPAFER